MIQCLVSPHVLKHKGWYITLKKQRDDKDKKEAAECAKLLAKRIKKPKKNTRNRLPRDTGCPL